jgi:hypothetical protein
MTKGCSLAVFAIGSFVLGCSSDGTTSDGGTDASNDVTTPDAAQEAGKDSGPTGCNSTSNIGMVVPQTFVATDAVTGDGGVLVQGTYALTAAVVYTGVDGGSGPTGTTYQDTAILDDAGVYERVASVINDAGLDGSPLRQNGSFAVDGGSIHVTQTCPAGTQPFTSYDSNGTVFHIYAPAAGPIPAVMFEYTKQ